MRAVDLPTAVEVTFDRDGKPSVHSFTRAGEKVWVIAMGRTWVDDAGRHLMVMGPGNESFELLLRRSDLTWRVVGFPESTLVV